MRIAVAGFMSDRASAAVDPPVIVADRLGGPVSLEPPVLVAALRRAGWIQVGDDRRHGTPDRARRFEQQQHLRRGQYAGAQEHPILVHRNRDAGRKAHQGLHHALVAERDREAPVLGTDAEPPIERLELQVDVGTDDGVGDSIE